MEYTLIRSRRRTLALQVTPEGEVIVRAPLRLARGTIDDFVRSREAWIEASLARVQTYRAAHPEPTEDERRALLARAKAELPPRVAYWSAQMGLEPTRIRITSAKTRFGSCSAKDSICFSWRLMQYPPEAIDYVVVHELAHIRHHDHSADFYALVARYIPDWRERVRLLRG